MEQGVTTPRVERVMDLQRLVDLILDTTPRLPRTRVIAMDGLGGSGKSTLANLIQRDLPSSAIIHTDDFASWDEPLEWWPRLQAQVLEPLRIGEPAHYQRYDWDNKALAEWVDLEPPENLILEGMSSSRGAFRPYLSYVVWVETPESERLKRGLERDGEHMQDQWKSWMQAEDCYVATERPVAHAQLVLSGMPQMTYDAKSQIVVLSR